MPLDAPIGSGLGIQNASNLRILRERITEVPLIVDAGVGTASDAAEAMELGADGILMNTAIAEAQDAVLMAEAMRDATIAGRKAYLAGRMPKRLYAAASSPLSGAGPGPIFWAAYQLGFYWVVVDVFQLVAKVSCVAANRIVVARLPKRTAPCA